jgi:hypothetical protein
MLGKTHGRIVAAIVVLSVIAVASVSICQHKRARREIGVVSTRFVKAASRLDLLALRDCLTDDGRALLPTCYTLVAAKRVSELNKGVRVSVHVEVAELKTNGTEAAVRLKRSVTQRGTRFGKPVDTRVNDECVVFCVYDGERWLVDLEHTVKDQQCPVADISLLKECLTK